MAVTTNSYTGNGSTTNYSFTFPYIATTDIKAQINGVVTTAFSLANATTVQFNSPPADGDAIVIYRETDDSEIPATFYAGSSIRSGDLNDNFRQTLYIGQETANRSLSVLGGEMVGDLGLDLNSKITFEGSTADDHETVLTVTNPTADRTITIPDRDGTIITTGDTGTVDNTILAADSVDSSKIVNGSIVNADIHASAAINLTKLEDVNSSKILVGNGSNKAAPVDMSGDVTIDNAGATTITANAVQIGNISDTETTLTSNSDAKIPTSKAVADHVVSVVNSIGGFVIVADKDSFPTSNPDPNNDAGTVLSITNPNGLTVSSGTSSNGTRTGVTDTVTITGIPTEAGSTLTANYTMLVQTTSTEHTYAFYKFLAKEGDVLNLSNDINDFAARYRVAATAPVTGLCDATGANTGSYPCDGDMFWNTSDNKMYVFGAPAASTSTSDLQAAWAEVSSTGQFKDLTVKTNGQPHNGTLTFDGTATQFDLFDGTSVANVTNRNQLLVVLNGVVQKSNSGTWSSSEEGFYLDGTDGIKFCTAPPQDSTIFVTLIGSAVEIPTPGDGTVTTTKIVDNAVTLAKLPLGDASSDGKYLKSTNGADPSWESVPAGVGGDNGVQFNDNVAVKFGTGSDNDLEIKHTPHANVLEANDGSIVINADEIQLLSNDTAGRAVYLDGPNDRLELGYDGHHSVLINTTGVQFVKDVQINAQEELRFADSDSTHYVGFKSPATVTTNKIWTLPDADAVSSGQALTSNASGTLAWSDVSSTVADSCIYENDQTISNAYTIAAGKGAHSVGPLTLNATVTVNGRWVIS